MWYFNNLGTNNGQSAALHLTEEQIQVLLTGKFGDGCFVQTPNQVYYGACCIYKEYIDFKAHLLGDLVSKITTVENKGFKEGIIYRFFTLADPRICLIADESLEDSLNRMTDLGFALWVYDDGSKHKDKEFYQINTQKYPKEVVESLFVPFLKNRFNITAIPTIERKKDGREFWYLRISKYQGADIINTILQKYPIECFKYKMWGSETIQKWSKLQEELKNEGIDIYSLEARTVSALLRKIEI